MKINNKLISKSNLPHKICMVCSRPFSWRKKWEREWENVKYCSNACRKNNQIKNEKIKINSR
ncbi:MAG: DUF2256 domain-containing protein [Bacteroidota bacterium]